MPRAGRSGALAQYVDKRFGRITALREGDQLATAVAAQLLANNPDRLHLVVTNVGATVAFEGTRRGLTSGLGNRLAANGGSIEYDPDIDGEGVGYAHYIISSGADTQIVYSETVAVGQEKTGA